MAGLENLIRKKDLVRGERLAPPRVGETGGLAMPTPPILVFVGGAGSPADLTLLSTTLTAVSDSVVSVAMLYDWANVGNTQYGVLSTAVGWTVVNVEIGFYRDGGSPATSPVNKFPSGCIFNALSNDHNVVVDCLMVKT